MEIRQLKEYLGRYLELSHFISSHLISSYPTSLCSPAPHLNAATLTAPIIIYLPTNKYNLAETTKPHDILNTRYLISNIRTSLLIPASYILSYRKKKSRSSRIINTTLYAASQPTLPPHTYLVYSSISPYN